MSERESYYYPPYDQASLLFMTPDVCRHMLPMFLDPGAHHPQSDSFPAGGGQDAQQVVPPMPIDPYPSTHSQLPLVVSNVPR
jgi:hypothetical protein